MMETVETREHEILTREDLDMHPSDMALAEHLKESNILSIRELRQGIEISSFNHIGMARFADFEVVVWPKLLLRQNLPRLVAYAFGFDDIKIQNAEAGFVVREANLIDILIDFFTKGCRRLIAQGLLKSYVTRHDDVPFLRGRLLLRYQLVHMVKKRPVFACEFDELEYDNLENRILLYCLEQCFHITQSPRLKKDARILARQFSGTVRHTEIGITDFERISYTRLNRHYKTLHNLAKLIITSTGIGEFSGKDATSSFFLDMNYVFERFVTRLFEEYHPYDVQSQKSKHAWNTDEKRLYIRTDILLDSKIVVDAKYKDQLSRGDLYQIGFYIHEYKQKLGYAILPEPSVIPEHITSVREKITICAKTININDVLNLIYTDEHEKMRAMIRAMVPLRQ